MFSFDWLELFKKSSFLRFTPLLSAFGLVIVVVGSTFVYVNTLTREIGYPGVGMQVTANEEVLADLVEQNSAMYRDPEFVPPPLNTDGPRAGDAYQNLQVLGHLSTTQFTRLMLALNQWVAPPNSPGATEAEAGRQCLYCHVEGNFASDEVYQKGVTRRMLQMTWQINEQWGAHVGQTGVNCWTCHRGNGIPEYHWFNDVPEPETFVGDRNQQNNPIADTGYSSLPTSAFEAFLDNDYEIRVQGNQALPPDELGVSVMRTEWTYSLMMHFSNSLGVNCTYCHNSRRWGSWEQSPSVRGTAWYGIRMVRQVNNEYMASVQGLFPEYYEGQRRLGPMGDVAKVSCMTCHQGAYRPMLGAPAYEDWPSLAHSPPMAEVAEVYATPEPEVPVEAAPPEAVEGEMVGDGEIVDTVEEAVEAVVEAVEAVEAEAPSAEE